MTHPLILHHFEDSPFSEKVRLAFGLKGLAWRSVLIPSIMPKPDLVPLTGGYRRTPVMQAGADVFCDTQVILAEIERRHPSPSMMAEGMAWAVNWWADRLFFTASVAVIFGSLGDQVDEAFIKDREALSGGRFDLAAMKQAVRPMTGQWRAQAGWIEAQLAQGGDWLAGSAPGLSDIAAYMNVWFLERNLPADAAAAMAGFERALAWRNRVASIGHGAREEFEPSAALDVARDAEPAGDTPHDEADPLGSPGDGVFVMADDYGRDPIVGSLVAANPERLVIERSDERVGRVHVHFPRTGYIAAKV